MMDTLVIHETVKEARDASGGPWFMRPRMAHTFVGAPFMGGPFKTAIYTHAAAMAICGNEDLRKWARNTVASRLAP